MSCSSERSSLQLLLETGERLTVSVHALPHDGREAQLPHDRHATELLAMLDVGEVDLDRRKPRDLERVADRPGVVRPRPGVQDDAVGEVLQAVQVLDELLLRVRLEEARREPEL